MLEKTYNYADIEPRIFEKWEKAEAFRAGAALKKNPKAKPFSIVIPPPNVTGSLHMGHALNNTLQDILARFERMRGRDVLWQPGTDHAGIATQSLVERQLMERQEPGRRELGRVEFLKRVWAWKEQSGGTIINQLKRLGASCDWSRERFTMDEGLSRAVIKVFVELYRADLIYKDKRLVNWDPKLQTAISDLEVISVEKRGTFTWSEKTKEEKPFDAAAFGKIIDRDPDGHLYYFKYPLTAKVKGYKVDHIVVATTRPETMLGDTAVAVHPSDKRYAALVKAGVRVRLPLVDREIPIIADDYADPEQGTGAVKITPAHDFNDFEVGRRHNLTPKNILTGTGRIVIEGNGIRNPDFSDVSEESFHFLCREFNKLDRFEARKKVVMLLIEQDLVQEIEPHLMKVPYGDRSNVAVEPFLTDQWYVDAKTLAKPALAAVREGKTDFIPENWRNVYFQWLENIQPWCISRQLWWGHRIPVWYGPLRNEDGHAEKLPIRQFVSGNQQTAFKEFACESDEAFLVAATKYYGKEPHIAENEFDAAIYQADHDQVAVWRDPDVLDTWFSSALWPFSTMGWPDKTPELKRYYPTSVLVTGFD
ncbi:MAG: class I tRNA ligase family protein, partial [Rhodomicrobium sp.]